MTDWKAELYVATLSDPSKYKGAIARARAQIFDYLRKVSEMETENFVRVRRKSDEEVAYIGDANTILEKAHPHGCIVRLPCQQPFEVLENPTTMAGLLGVIVDDD